MKKLLILGGNSDIGIQLLADVINHGSFLKFTCIIIRNFQKDQIIQTLN